MYAISLVLVINCVQIIQQSQSRSLRSIPDETLSEKIISMMDLDTTKQFSETSRHLNQMTKIQMNRFEEESVAADYREAMNIMNLNAHRFVSQFPYLTEGANKYLHDTFRSNVCFGPSVNWKWGRDRFKKHQDIYMNDWFLYFQVREFKDLTFHEWDDTTRTKLIRFLVFPMRNGQITGCSLLQYHSEYVDYIFVTIRNSECDVTLEHDPSNRYTILQSAFGQKRFQMNGRTWITSQHPQFSNQGLRVGRFMLPSALTPTVLLIIFWSWVLAILFFK